MRGRLLAVFGVAVMLGGAAAAPSMKDILDASPKGDWRAVDADQLLIMQLPKGRVVIALAPAFAPNTIANIRTLVGARYFDGAAIVRAQDNYVVQWARSDKRSLGSAKATITAEFDRPIEADAKFTALSDPDTYAPQTGFVDGFPVARDPGQRREWLTHCYAMVGVGRDTDADSGSGQELYAVIGQSPRNLDRNVTLVGRIIEGMELLSTLPRGTGALGFYVVPKEQPIPIVSIRLGSEMPPAQRPHVDMLRTDSATFAKLIAERRARRDVWYRHSPDRIGVCNMPLPVRIDGK